ncbi:MAG: hypothetical protein EHM39_06245 [Chloroflexi bacterium]|nr:MAG: hypothetical protein EHM39_06245 [Chloroflexota bacterium]
MFAPMTPTTERIRIQNENAELNRYAAELHPSKLGAMLLLALHAARAKSRRDARPEQPAVAARRASASDCA